MTELQKAVEYIRLYPTLSFHHVATKFKVDVQKLHEAYKESRKVTM